MEENNLNQELLDDNNFNGNNMNREEVQEEINSAFNNSLILIFITILVLYYIYDEFCILFSLLPKFFYPDNKISDNVYETCIKYPSMVEIYSCLFFIFISLIFIFPLFLVHIPNEEFAQKLFNIYAYFSYYILGPFSTGFSIIGLIFYKNVCYTCINNEPTNLQFDYSLLLSLVISLSLGIIITFGFNGIEVQINLLDSIKLKEGSNYLLGKLFWKMTQYRRGLQQNEIHNE